MLTIFTIPKRFNGHIGIIQRNAIQSWTLLHPDIEVILCGDDSGTREISEELNLEWIPDVARNEYGTPLLNSTFTKVSRWARHHLLCYVNCDIILLSDFTEAIEHIPFRKFLLLGQRTNLEIPHLLDFSQEKWKDRLLEGVKRKGKLDNPFAMDYFVFPNHPGFTNLPPFAVGRPGWDNFFVFNARKLRIPVIDATRVVTAIHQMHDYHHVPFRKGEKWEGPEADLNRKYANHFGHIFGVKDATYIYYSGSISPALSFEYIRNLFSKLDLIYPRSKPIIQILKRIKRTLWKNHVLN